MIKNIISNKYIIVIATTLFVNLIFTGCYSIKEVNIEKEKPIKIYKIETNDGKIISYRNNKLGFALLLNNNIISITQNGEQEILPVSNVKKYYSEKFDFGKTFLAVIGGTAVIFIISLGILALLFHGNGVGG